ncbi:Phytoene dehydrogenase or related enzyme [Halapricum desulfuricans]|uniref:Phytoene dehydrogenase or related enzyme n=1 Tax=Halapricum desulfuricans TaxID=2841257 RepID=A0A897N8C2_9EURY|nr:Phytoene dehydrogenase or related enzyme [Halapricum desulfuricans]
MAVVYELLDLDQEIPPVSKHYRNRGSPPTRSRRRSSSRGVAKGVSISDHRISNTAGGP